jgi:tetratricopeptide (TPR) repeat protein
MVQQKVSALQATLQKNPADFDSWIDLGIYQKMAGDYNATITSWQYAGLLSPTNFVSFGDLGDLYAYFLKDTAQSEKYYAQAIKNGPTQAYLYIQLAQVEHDVEQNSAKALATVNAGLAKIPNDPSLLQYKATLSQ